MESKIIKAIKNPKKAIYFLVGSIIYLPINKGIYFFINAVYNPFIDFRNKFRGSELVNEISKNLNLSALKAFNEIKKHSLKKTDINDHLITLFIESIKIKPKLIVELGVRGGESTFALERVAKVCNAKLISVDIVDCSKVSSYKDWIFIKSDDIKFAKEFKKWCKENNIEPQIDILFIDTLHLYEHALQEIKHWFPFLSDRSKVFFHDTNTKGIYQRKDGSKGVVSWNNPGWRNDRGVIRALEKFFNKLFSENESFIDFEKGFLIKHYPLCNGLTILEKDSSTKTNS